MQLNDGRFACGLNFGNAAFDGSNRWIQVEFRNPAGSGQYQALTPRDKITATPYALYALNGANGVWVYDTNQQAVTVTGKKVGIGTSNPTAALEVVDAVGGDDSVKLPAGSVGAAELAGGLAAVAGEGSIGNPLNITCSAPGYLLLIGSGSSNYVGRVIVDGTDRGVIPMGNGQCGNSYTTWSLHRRIEIGPGSHVIELSWIGGGCVTGSFTALYFPAGI